MPEHDMIVIGTSAGGLEALTRILQDLPPDLPATICVVQHIPAVRASLLPKILNRTCTLPVQHPPDGTPLQPGHIYVAPPDHHMLVRQQHLHVIRGPRENGFRPAIDATFRTAAQAYGPRVVGVILTGMLDDGTAGLLTVKRYGGTAIVQSPKEALYPDMPTSACRYVKIDAVLSLEEIAAELLRLTHTPATEEGGMPMTERDDLEARMAELDLEALQQTDTFGPASPFSCPDCGGTLTEFYDSDLLRFRCQIGHAYSPQSLFVNQGDMLDRALDAALRSLEERAYFACRLAQEARNGKDSRGEQRFRRLAQEAEERKEQIRRVILAHKRQVDASEAADGTDSTTG